MPVGFIQRSICMSWFYWHFFEVPKKILAGWKNFLLFNLNYFSVPVLLTTLFSPWRRYSWSYGRGFSFSRYFEAVVSNSFSRFIGFIMRLFLIFVGLLAQVFIILGGIIVFLGWLFLPVFLIFIFILGVKIVY